MVIMISLMLMMMIITDVISSQKIIITGRIMTYMIK